MSTSRVGALHALFVLLLVSLSSPADALKCKRVSLEEKAGRSDVIVVKVVAPRIKDKLPDWKVKELGDRVEVVKVLKGSLYKEGQTVFLPHWRFYKPQYRKGDLLMIFADKTMKYPAGKCNAPTLIRSK
jgi:hypothetical protein